MASPPHFLIKCQQYIEGGSWILQGLGAFLLLLCKQVSLGLPLSQFSLHHGLIIGVSKTNHPHAWPSNSGHCPAPSPKVQEGTLRQLLSDLGVELISKHPIYLETKEFSKQQCSRP